MDRDNDRLPCFKEGGSPTKRADRMFRSARAALTGPSPQALSRIQGAIEDQVRAPAPWVRRLSPAAALFLFVAGTAAASSYGVRVLAAWRQESSSIPHQVRPPARPRTPPQPPPAPTPSQPPPPPLEIAPSLPEKSAQDAAHEPAHRVPDSPPLHLASSRSVVALAREPAPGPVDRAPRVAPPITDSALAAESRMLATALRQLRKQRDSAAALATLDDLRAQHPVGLLADEAAVARVDALVSLGRSEEALRELERLAPTLMPGTVRRAQLQLLRAELLVGAGRCAEALTLFDALVSSGGITLERALFGRARARSQVGDLAGSRADLQSCLTLFPQGPLAERAGAELAR